MGLSLSRYLNIQRAERPRLAWLYAMLFSSIIGTIWGEAVIEAGFLRNVGVQNLPLAIAGSALVSMGTISVYNLFADRVSNHSLLVTILTIAILGIGIGVFLLANGLVFIAFPLLYVLDIVLFRDLLNTHWPIYVNGFFDTQSAKRIIPVLSSATRLAAIMGGLSMPILNRNLSPTDIIAIMLLMQVAMLTFALLMRRVMGDRSKGSPPRKMESETRRATQHIQEGYRYVKGSGFLRWIAAAVLLMMILLAFINYQSGRLLLENLKTVQNISNFTGLLNAVGNLVALPLQLFFLSRLIGRTGVGNAAIIYPSASFLAVTWLAWVPNFFTAGYGYLTRTVLRTTFFTPVDGLLYNAVPLRLKARARGFINGYVMTTGSLIGGLLLLVLTQQPVAPLLTILFSALALAYLISALQVKRHYGKAVLTMLEHEDFISLLAPANHELASVDNSTLSRLVQKMSGPEASPDLKVFMAQVICSVGDAQAVKILDDHIRQTSDGRLRARFVETLAAYLVNPADAEGMFVACLSDPEKEVRQAALGGLERGAGNDPARLQALVTPFLEDADMQVRAAALSALINQRSFSHQPKAIQVLDNLLTSEQPEQRALGARLLVRLAQKLDEPGDGVLIYQLLRVSRDPSDEVRLAAAQSLEEALKVNASISKWLPIPTLLQLLCDPVERVRCSAAALLGKSSSPEALPALVEALQDSSAVVRFAIIESLVKVGPEAIQNIQPMLESKNSHIRTAGAIILCRIDPVQYGPMIQTGYLLDQLQAVYHNWGTIAALAEAPASPLQDLLKSALLEQNAQRIAEFFSVLGTLFSPSAIDRIASALQGKDALKRANALEALEVMTTPKITRLLGPLCEQPPELKAILEISHTTWGYSTPSRERAIQELRTSTEDPWIGEIALMLASPGATA